MSGPGRRRYEILSTLGRGGFGTVYRAQLLGEGGFRKTVALKVLNDDVGHQAELARRLRDEARILGMLRHRAVVQVDDLVELDGRWTVVMELVDGVDLGVVVEHGGLPLRPALEVVQEVASALHLAWSAPGPSGQPLRIVHRDIKPGNILVGRQGEVKILDFGIARAEFGDREAVTRSVGFGSPEYMSPERLEWQSGPEGDLYALGAVLYELLAGVRFGMSSGHPARHQRRVDEALAGLRERLGPAGEGVTALIGGLLAYEPEDRPTARALERACDALIVAAGGERLRDWAEEHVPALQGRQQPLRTDVPTGKILVEASAQSQHTMFLQPQEESLPEASPQEGPSPPIPAPSQTAPISAQGPPLLDEEGPDLPAPTRRPLGAIAAAGLLILAAGIGFASWPDDPAPPTEPPALATAVTEGPAASTPVPEPPVEAPAISDPTPVEAPAAQAPPATPAALSTRSSERRRAAERETPVEAPTAEPDQGGTVILTGDAEKVTLQRGSQRYAAPGSVPAGTYEVLVTFPDREPIASGSVSVLAGGKLTLSCSAQFKRCNAR